VSAAPSCHAEALRVGGSHFCEGWLAARFVIRKFFLLNSAFLLSYRLRLGSHH